MTHFERMLTRIKILLIFTIMITVLVVGYETVIMITPETLYSTISSQQWVCQRIVKDALIIQDITDTNEKSTAISELQNVLPYFEDNQTKINATNKSSSVTLIIKSGQPNFVFIDTAAKKFLIHPDKIQLQIILDNERQYFLTQNQALSIIAQEQISKYYTIFGVILCGKLIIIITCVIILSIVYKIKGDKEPKVHRMNTQENVGSQEEI